MERPNLAIGLLGPLEVTVDGLSVDIPRGRVRALLAVLALSPRQPVSNETLAERIWADDLPANLGASLHTSVLRLRRLLGADRVVTTAGGYLLDAEVDAERFGQLLDRAADARADGEAETRLLRAALRLWRGNPFDPPLSDWLTHSERPALVDRRLAATERLADLEITAGRAAVVVPELHDLIRQHPLRESLWRRYLVALERSGRAGDALAEYQVVRAVIARELGVEPGAELRHVHLRLQAGEPLSAVSPAADHRAPPRQLPAAVGDFVGRSAGLHDLSDWLERAGPGPVVVHGAGGTGKTALVVHWAGQVRRRFDDGELFVDLRGYGPGDPVDPADALDMLLTGLAVPADQVPSGIEARAALARSVLTGRRMLVVLDNARDVEQVRPLLVGAGTVVVTSRSRLTGLADPIHRIGLDVLPSEESRTLLAERLKALEVGFDDASLTAMAELCGHLPLALTVAAERAGRYPDSPLADLIRQVRDERDRLDLLETGGDLTTSLRAVMSWSYRALDADLARLFRLLGLPPGADLGVPAAAALAGISKAAASALLDQLAEAHLLGRPRPGRFAMHDLVRVYAAEQAVAEEAPTARAEALRRLYQWYGYSGAAAHAVISVTHPISSAGPGTGVEPLGFEDEGQAMGWFATELPVLPAVVAGAQRVGLHREVCALARAVTRYYMHLSKVPAEIASMVELALSAARSAGDELAEAQLLNQYGTIYCRPGEFEQALPLFVSSYRLYRRLGNAFGEVAALGNIGFAHWHLGDLEAAADHLQQAVDAGRQHRLGVGIASTLTNLAEVHSESGRHDEAELAATEAVGLLRGAGRRLETAYAIDTLGTIETARGNPAAAAGHLARAAELFRQVGSEWDLAGVLRSLGVALRDAGDPAAARTHWDEALRLLDRSGAEDSAELSRAELRELLSAGTSRPSGRTG